jgi:hypothetical protein
LLAQAHVLSEEVTRLVQEQLQPAARTDPSP